LVRPKRLPPSSPWGFQFTLFIDKMARPPKEKKEKRSFRYTFRMTEEEMGFLERLSGYSGLPPAEVIRASVFKNRLPQAKMPLLDRQAYLELKRIGNNINQIARHYNSRITVPEHRLKTFDSLSGKLDSIIKALIDDR
jgi:hypothetical protein